MGEGVGTCMRRMRDVREKTNSYSRLESLLAMVICLHRSTHSLSMAPSRRRKPGSCTLPNLGCGVCVCMCANARVRAQMRVCVCMCVWADQRSVRVCVCLLELFRFD